MVAPTLLHALALAPVYSVSLQKTKNNLVIF